MDMLQDLQARWYSPINVGDYVFINYGDIAQKEIVTNKNGETDEIETNYIRNLNVDLNACGKSFANSLWQKIYIDENKNISPNFPDSENNVYVFINFEDGFHPIYETDEEGNKIKDKETGEDIVKMYIDNDTGAECTKEGIIKNTNISIRRI